MMGIQNHGTGAHPAQRNLSRRSLLIGRALILFTAVLLAVMPLTEHLWTFDQFFRSGQDLEFGLLALATILCLVLVVSQRLKQVVDALLSAWRWVATIRYSRARPLLYIHERLAFFREGSGIDHRRIMYTLQLQI